jgi:hypothetical protein
MEIINRKKKNTINKFEIALKNWTLSTQTLAAVLLQKEEVPGL